MKVKEEVTKEKIDLAEESLTDLRVVQRRLTKPKAERLSQRQSCSSRLPMEITKIDLVFVAPIHYQGAPTLHPGSMLPHGFADLVSWSS